MTMAKHRRRVPWWKVRAAYRDLLAEHQKLQRDHAALERDWSEVFTEAERLRDRYEPVPATSWGAVNAAAIAAGTVLPEAVTEEFPVYAVGVDPATGTDPAGIAVIRVDEQGNAEVINDAE